MPLWELEHLVYIVLQKIKDMIVFDWLFYRIAKLLNFYHSDRGDGDQLASIILPVTLMFNFINIQSVIHLYHLPIVSKADTEASYWVEGSITLLLIVVSFYYYNKEDGKKFKDLCERYSQESGLLSFLFGMIGFVYVVLTFVIFLYLATQVRASLGIVD